MASEAKNKKWLGYALYVVLVTLVLLYYLFPAKTVEETFVSGIKKMNPSLGFKVEKTGLAIPAGIRLDNAQVYLEKTGGPPLFEAASIYVEPRILEALKGSYSFDLSGRAYKGDITGFFGPVMGGDSDQAVEISFRNFDLAGYRYLGEIIKHQLTGRFSGNFTYNSNRDQRKGSRGKASLRLADGLLQFQAPIFGISSVDLQDISMELELRKKEITVVRAELTGPEMKASVNGSILLQENIPFSQLNLKGTLEPLAEFYKNYPEIRELLKSMKKRVKRGQYIFTITGTLGEPRFRLL